MPIRINLLAEQQAAEEARRRDPVKRAIFICSALIALMLLWGLSLYFDVRSARKELTDFEARLLTVEDKAKQAKLDKQMDADIIKRLRSLERYRENRFFWGNVMNALQHVALDNVRFTDFGSDQKYIPAVEAKLKTNLVFKIPPPKPAWKFWAKAPPSTNALVVVTNLIVAMTNKPPFSTNKVPVNVKIAELTTNAATSEVTAKLEVITPSTSTESISTTIDARDYSNPPGNLVEELRRKIADEPYFKRNLSKVEGEGIRLKDRLFKPERDELDPFNSTGNFIRFTLECNYEKRILANE